MRLRIPLLISLALGVAVAALCSRVATRFTAARVEVGRVQRTQLDPDVVLRLAKLDERVFVQYFVTAREHMPSRLRSLEADVADVLEAMRAVNPRQFDFQIVDPAGDDDLVRFAARRKVAPTRVRSVTKDAVTEQEIWSTLTVARGTLPPAVANGIRGEHVRQLARLVIAQLDGLEQPRVPRFGLITPKVGYAKLRAKIAEKGEVVALDSDLDPALERCDALIWMEPKAIDAPTIERLRHFIDRGRSAFVAGSRWRHRVVADASVPGGSALELEDSSFGVDALAQGFGLSAAKSLILDARNVGVDAASGAAGEPYRVLAIAPNFDFKSMSADLGGQVEFATPTTFTPDAERLAELGLVAEPLITTSENTWTIDVGGRFVATSALGTEVGVPLAKQPLLIRVEPVEPWRGFLALAGAATPFRDEFLDVEQRAHQRLVQVICESMTTQERLLYARLPLDTAQPLPEQSAFARTSWRLFAIGFVPLVLGLVRRRRGVAGVALARAARSTGIATRSILGVAAAAALTLIAARMLGAMDVSRAGLLRFEPLTAALAERASGEGRLRATWFVSSDAALPPEMKEPIGRLRGALDRLRGAGAQLELDVVHPDALTQDERKALEREGVRARRATSTRDEATTVRSVFATLRLEARGRREQLEFATPRACENLEFRLAFALWRLETGKRATLAVASDVPRLSGAEAHQYFQSRGLIPPKGIDVYAAARAVLAGLDFDVVHVNPQQPVLPQDVAAIVWLQPRRPCEAMMAVLARHAYRGGSALVAAQHFVMQARQYRGADFDFVFWPQPQSPDVDQFWFPEFGVKLVREVLFDALHTHVPFESQVHASARREFRAIDLAAPFNVRVLSSPGPELDGTLRGLGDLPFLFSSFFEFDGAQLAAAGLTARTLLTTSARSWTFLWAGGWLERALLVDPPHDKDGKEIAIRPRLPLVVDLRGTFPWPKRAFAFAPVEIGPDGQPKQGEVPAFPELEPVAERKPGRIVMSACSELWKDDWLLELSERFRADHLLENLVVDLALGPEFTALVAKRHVAQAFAPPDEEFRTRQRVFALTFLPVVGVLIGIARWLALLRRLA
ncbi:MAG: Gldg family protein [Planctomycetes bacterium]|nr:Gldg family protein [Planctomycetota bacterium]